MSALSDMSLSAAAQRRKKPVTYGRPSRNPAFTPQSVGSFFEEADKTDRTPSRRIKLPTRKPVLKKLTPSHQSQGRDEFDVPISDEEESMEPLPKTTPAKKVAATPLRKRHEGTTKTGVKPPKEHKRKSLEDAPAQKRTRTSSPVSPDVAMTMSASILDSTSPGAGIAPALYPNPDSAEGGKNRRSRRNATNATNNTMMRASPVKGISAPARLDDMISSITPQHDESIHSVQDEDFVEGDELPGTPIAPPSTRPGTLRRTTSTTPKQSQLWSQLLSSDPVEPDAEVAPNFWPCQAAAPTRRQRFGSSVMKKPTAETDHGDIPRQARLLDRLKQPTQSGLGEHEDEDDSQASDEYAMQSINHSFSAPRVVISQDVQPPQSASQVSTAPPVSASKTTYARTRSYLEEDTLEANLMLSLPTTSAPRPPAVARRSGAGPPAKGKPASTFDMSDDSDDNSNGAIRSIHELRAAGNKKRFLDDNSALFDDIKDHKLASRSRRRGALMELATKLFDKPFLIRFVEHGYDRELSTEFTAPYPDPISDAILCAVLVQISELDVGDKSILALYLAGALDVTLRCVSESRSTNQVARDRSNNMSKVAQATFSDLLGSVRTLDLWGGDQPNTLTIQLLGLRCMESMVLRLRRQGNKGGILGKDIVAELVGLAVEVDCSAMEAELDANPKHVAQKLALSILEFASTSDALATTWSSELWVQLVSTLPKTLQSQDESQALALKLCINLTNNNVANCDVCARSEAIEVLFGQIAKGFHHLHEGSDEQEDVLNFDNLILSLGLMINLAEFSDEAREMTVGLQENGLATLTDIFVRGQERVEEAQSEEETQSNVAYGFLAVLLGNICQNSGAREEVRACLPGKNLRTLVAAIDEFAQYNMKVDSQTFEGEEGRDVWEHFTGRLMAVVTRLQELDE